MKTWEEMSIPEKMLLVMRVGSGDATDEEIDLARRNAL